MYARPWGAGGFAANIRVEWSSPRPHTRPVASNPRRILIEASFPSARKSARRLGSSDEEIDELFDIVATVLGPLAGTKKRTARTRSAAKKSGRSVAKKAATKKARTRERASSA